MGYLLVWHAHKRAKTIWQIRYHFITILHGRIWRDARSRKTFFEQQVPILCLLDAIVPVQHHFLHFGQVLIGLVRVGNTRNIQENIIGNFIPIREEIDCSAFAEVWNKARLRRNRCRRRNHVDEALCEGIMSCHLWPLKASREWQCAVWVILPHYSKK